MQGRTAPCPPSVPTLESLPSCAARRPQATCIHTPIPHQTPAYVLPSSSPQPGPCAPRSFAQHLPAGPGPPVLLLIPLVPLALWPIPLGGLLRGAKACWAPGLPDLSSLGSRGLASPCGSELSCTSGSAWVSLHPRICSEPSGGGKDTGFSWAPGLRVSAHVLSPDPGLLAPPRERSRGTKSVFCGELGFGLAMEASDSLFGPPGGWASCWGTCGPAQLRWALLL